MDSSELVQELQEVRREAAATKEELNSYIESSLKLQEQIQVPSLYTSDRFTELTLHFTELALIFTELALHFTELALHFTELALHFT